MHRNFNVWRFPYNIYGEWLKTPGSSGHPQLQSSILMVSFVLNIVFLCFNASKTFLDDAACFIPDRHDYWSAWATHSSNATAERCFIFVWFCMWTWASPKKSGEFLVLGRGPRETFAPPPQLQSSSRVPGFHRKSLTGRQSWRESQIVAFDRHLWQ